MDVDANTGTLTLKAATGTTPVTITATVAAHDVYPEQKVTLTPLTLTFRIDGASDGGQNGQIWANGTQYVNAVLSVKNQDGDPVNMTQVSFNEVGTSGLRFSPVTPQGWLGQSYSGVRSVSPGTYKIMANIDGHPITDLNANVTYAFDLNIKKWP